MSTFMEEENLMDYDSQYMVLPVKQSNPCTSTAETLHSRKTEGAAQKSCLVPLNHFWYMSHIYKEGIKQIERKNKIKMVAQVHVTFEAEQEDGNLHEALSEFIDLSQICSADSGQAVIPLKFVDPDQWSDALKVIKRNKDKILLTMSSEEVIVSGPKQSQDEFSAVLNAMQKTNTPAEQHKPTSDDTSLRLNLTDKYPYVNARLLTEKNSRKVVMTSTQDFNAKDKCGLEVRSSNEQDNSILGNLFLPLYQNMSYGATAVSYSPKNSISKYSGKKRERKRDSRPEIDNFIRTSTRQVLKDNEDDKCSICLSDFTNKKQLKCKHEFCEDCLQNTIKTCGPACPICKDVFGVMKGNQPDGKMSWDKNPLSLPGFPDCGHIFITYNIPSGKQTETHPMPGQYYGGTTRYAYLPDNEEGNEVLLLLKKAFDQKLIFTVGTSITTGAENVVTWNDINHKTSVLGGPENFGYPDENYLSRVKEQLKAKGIQ